MSLAKEMKTSIMMLPIFHASTYLKTRYAIESVISRIGEQNTLLSVWVSADRDARDRRHLIPSCSLETFSSISTTIHPSCQVFIIHPQLDVTFSLLITYLFYILFLYQYEGTCR
jgi:hypothetical protein